MTRAAAVTTAILLVSSKNLSQQQTSGCCSVQAFATVQRARITKASSFGARKLFGSKSCDELNKEIDQAQALAREISGSLDKAEHTWAWKYPNEDMQDPEIDSFPTLQSEEDRTNSEEEHVEDTKHSNWLASSAGAIRKLQTNVFFPHQVQKQDIDAIDENSYTPQSDSKVVPTEFVNEIDHLLMEVEDVLAEVDDDSKENSSPDIAQEDVVVPYFAKRIEAEDIIETILSRI